VEKEGWLRVQDACRHLHIGKTTFYELCKLEGLRHVRIGNKILTKVEWLDTWVEGRSIVNKFD
jgi:excisionase family DNA binding protein